MEVKKTPKADLQNKRGLFLEIGLAVALACTLFAFEYSSRAEEKKELQTPMDEQVEEEIIQITFQNLKPPPPPPPTPKLTDIMEIVEDDSQIDEELEIEDVNDMSEVQDVVDYEDYGDYGEEYSDEEMVYQFVEEMPQFPGGDLQKWLQKQARYPMSALENGISGKVFVQFVVEKDGSVTGVQVVRSVDRDLDNEALRVVKSMPKWKPGRQQDKAVRVKFTVPVNFQMQNR